MPGAEPKTSERLFDAAESAFGPVDILINNATGWVADTFSPTPSDRFGHRQVRVSAETIDRQFAVDARGAALLVAEFAQRHAARGATWGRIIALTSGGPTGFPNEGRDVPTLPLVADNDVCLPIDGMYEIFDTPPPSRERRIRRDVEDVVTAEGIGHAGDPRFVDVAG